ncbi:beta strand repeat-containing protein [Deinococcus oregonensis]|uniref:Beta strand repeat-containing protein n=1 Tax=Deinococcus oregonensis TaxID=1805970 RepID=A0ABV6B6Y5_9DEIO
MKIINGLKLSGAMLGLTVLLTACPGVTPPMSFDLTVTLEGVTSAPVTVTNTTTGIELFKGTLDTSKTFTGLTANDVFKVESGAVNGYTSPAAQTITLDASKTATLAYIKATPAPTYDLTVKLSGVASAPVTVTNTVTNTEVFKGTLEASKTFTGLSAGSVLKIEGGNVDGNTTPAPQTITLDASQTVTLTYIKPTPAPTYDLTVNLSGVASAPVTVTNMATNTEVFKGTLEASKTFIGLPANSVLKIEGGAVADYAAPSAQTVTLDASKSLSLTYTALAGTALDAARVKGTIPGWTADPSKIAFQLSNMDTTVDGSPADISVGGAVNAALPTPSIFSDFLEGCRIDAGTTGSTFRAEFARPVAINSAGSILGTITETTVTGNPILRVYSQTATSLKGAASCGSYTRLDLDLTINVGWNALSIVESNTSGGTKITLRSVPSDARIQLGFIPERPSVRLSATDYSQLVLRAGTPVTREITITPTGAISGSLDLSTSLPGVKVTPSTINLTGTNSLSAQSARGLSLIQQAVRAQALTTTVTFSLTDQATTSYGSLELIASQGSTELGSTSFYADIRVPAVSVNLGSMGTSPLNAYQGGTTNVALSVSSQEGFSGDVTLNLTDLPMGVTANPVTINVPANATTSINVPLQVAADALLGTSTVKITGAKLSNQYGPNSFTLNVKPSRTSLGNLYSSSVAPAASGVWVVGSSSYSGATTLRRIAEGQVVKNVTLDNIAGSFLAIPGGDIYALGSEYYNNTNIYRIKDDGSFSTLNTVSTAGMSNGAVDAQGSIWFSTAFTNENGVYTYGLFKWDSSTGARILIDSGQAYSYGTAMIASSNGKYILYRPGYSGGLVLINTSTATKTPVANPSGGSMESPVVSNTGQVWYSNYGTLTRVNSDGTTTGFNVSGGASRLFGFDQNNSNTLWAAAYTGILKVDSTTGAIAQIPTDSVVSGTVNTSGGVSFLTTGSYTGYGYEYFLSVLP